ncbi:beta-galactosidase [Acetatifactor muris]|uniref:Beta-galactosidase n=1 Tax=Acetatifactor muris TaxID=879566 RepID=A0A2K4ZGE7_9FIRM|nr:beta-galactosidase [Acetatifactor muris]MCR2045798.1 beta-galactosidase [Acetatifactor muris]SOY29535.1 Beta-galactosidase BgaA [Acetatifactor muris]
MYYGVSYYPEHKEPEALRHDLLLLKESGINTVRMGEFAWCRMEPQRGEYCFDWLEDVVNELGRAGIRTVLCTPTACPPAWLVSAHPEILYVDNRGVTRPFGGRRHYCYNNETYRRFSAGIAEALARALGGNPFVLGFQIDNEPAQEGTGRCHCPVCVRKFQGWLEEKYQTIEALNRHWGTIFWSMEYDSFSQIQPPVNTIEVHAEQSIPAYYENPGLRLSYERFCSESQIEYQNIQAEILRRYSSHTVTTNATGLAANSIQYYQGFRTLDRYAFDFYPDLRSGEISAFPYAFARGIKPDRAFWILEFTSGGGHKLNGGGRKQSSPGALKQAAVHALAHGAEMLLHFQFRSFPFGAEQLNYAILDADGLPRRRYYEMQETAGLLEQLKPLEKSEIVNSIAFCFDYDTCWALKIKPVNEQNFDYIKYQSRLFRLLGSRGYGADVISPEADWERYPVLILTSGFLMSRSRQKKVREYVERGGIVVATFLTSVKDEHNTGYTDSLPAGLTDVFGVTVSEVEPVYADNHTRLKLEPGKMYVVEDNVWSELLSGPARPLGTYVEDYKQGSMVISSHTYGKGKAYYVGTDLPDRAWGELLDYILSTSGIQAYPFLIPEGVWVCCRILQGREIYFLFQFDRKEVMVPAKCPVEDYLTGERYETHIPLAGNGFCIVRKSHR